MTDDAPTPAAPPPATPTDAPEPQTLKPRWYSGRSVLALGVSVVALVLAGAPYLSPTITGGQARAYLMAHPEVLDEVLAARDQKAASQRSQAIDAAVAANPRALAAGPGEPAFGPADAKVTVVQFFDYQCPYCKQVAPDFGRLIAANPDVRFIFKEWPVLDRDGKITSQYSARAALAAHAQGKYLAVHQQLMAERALTPEGVDRVLAANGVAADQARAAIQSPMTTGLLAMVHTDASSIGLQGTPTFFINGKVTPTNDPAVMAQMIAAAKAG